MELRGSVLLLLYRKHRVTLKCENYDSYRAKSPSGGESCRGFYFMMGSAKHGL